MTGKQRPALAIAATTAALALVGTGAGFKAATSQRPAMPSVTFSTSDTLPACIVEDGNGMPLCWWDARAQGNHTGTPVISGDCAPSVMGGRSALCVRLYDLPLAALHKACEAVKKSGGYTFSECVTVWHETH